MSFTEAVVLHPEVSSLFQSVGSPASPESTSLSGPEMAARPTLPAPRDQDFPSKSTGVGCHCLLQSQFMAPGHFCNQVEHDIPGPPWKMCGFENPILAVGLLFPPPLSISQLRKSVTVSLPRALALTPQGHGACSGSSRGVESLLLARGLCQALSTSGPRVPRACLLGAGPASLSVSLWNVRPRPALGKGFPVFPGHIPQI